MREQAIRPGVLVLSVLFVIGVVAFGMMSLLSQVVRGSFDRTSTLVPHSGRLDITTSTGNVTVVPSRDERVHVRTEARYGLDEPTLVEETDAAGLRLAAHCESFLATRCEVSYTVEVPQAIAVTVEGDGGDVTVRGTTGPVTVSQRSGDVFLQDLAGPVEVTTIVGEVRGSGLRGGSARIDTGSGDVLLDMAVPPDQLQVISDSGEIEVGVPPVPYRVDARSRAGDERIAVPIDLTSRRLIVVSSGAEDVSVRPAR